MSAEDYIICPHCGKENLIQATRCIFCKEDLDIIPKSATDLASNDEDLSQMLSAMAAEDREVEIPTPQDSPGNLMPETYNPQPPSNEANDSDEIPTWLAHVRQRAQTEGDAQGLYNRGSEPVSGQKLPSRESLDQPFNSWIGRIHESRTNDEASVEDTVDAKEDDMPVWLKRVRDLQLQPNENAIQKPTGVEAWKQEWSEEDLERLKNGEFDEKLILQPSLLEQARGAEAGAAVDKSENNVTQPDQASAEVLSNSEFAEQNVAKGEISDSPASDQGEAPDVGAEPMTVGSQEAQAEILKEVVAAESVPQYKKLAEKPKKSDIWRWIGILFLLAILAAFWFLFLNRPAPAPLGIAAGTAFWNRLDSIQPAGKVLVILDYQPATADEMHANLQPIMARLKAQSAQVSLIALWPDGLWLGRELLEEAAFPLTTELNFLPGGSLAMLANAAGLKPAGSALETQTSLISNSLALKEKELILYATDNPESAKTWIEQVGSFLQPEQSLMVSTQASQVMLQPYYDSSQIAGLSTSPYLADGQLGAPNPPIAATPAFEAGMGVMAGFLALSFIRKLVKTGKSTTNEDGQN
jgi:hypothetical protein